MIYDRTGHAGSWGGRTLSGCILDSRSVSHDALFMHNTHGVSFFSRAPLRASYMHFGPEEPQDCFGMNSNVWLLWLICVSSRYEKYHSNDRNILANKDVLQVSVKFNLTFIRLFCSHILYYHIYWKEDKKLEMKENFEYRDLIFDLPTEKFLKCVKIYITCYEKNAHQIKKIKTNIHNVCTHRPYVHRQNVHKHFIDSKRNKYFTFASLYLLYYI